MSRIATAVLPAFALLVSTGAAWRSPSPPMPAWTAHPFPPGRAAVAEARRRADRLCRRGALLAPVRRGRRAALRPLHGMVVRFVVKPSDVIIAELANARDAGVPAPADLVLLLGERDQRRLIAAGLDAGVDLVGLLPNARDIGWTGATVTNGPATPAAPPCDSHVARSSRLRFPPP